MSAQYPCKECGYAYTKTLGTNKSRSGTEARRRRICIQCKKGFVTYEISAADYQFLQAVRKWITEKKAELDCNNGDINYDDGDERQ